MIYNNVFKASFIDRPNRFIANVWINGKKEQVHVRNTGRCKEILKEGSIVYLEKAKNPKRKTKYSLISAYKEGNIINIDSQIPNQVVYDAILNNKIDKLLDVDLLKPEVSFKDSRFDFYYEKDEKNGFIEVKGVTLEKNKIAMFPDAPTTRGTKHIETIIESLELGMNSYLIFLIQINNIKHFKPNKIMDPNFFKALKIAHKKGIEILAYNSKVSPYSISIGEQVKVEI